MLNCIEDVKFLVKVDGELQLYNEMTICIPYLENKQKTIKSVEDTLFLEKEGCLKIDEILGPCDEEGRGKLEVIWISLLFDCKVIDWK